MRHQTNRKRFFHWPCQHTEPVHGHAVEYFIETIILLAAFMFVIGSYCFLYDDAWVLELGDLLYMLASFIYAGVSLYSMREFFQAWPFQTQLERTENEMEFFEHICYVVSCLVFTVGAVLYWPHIYRGDDHTRLRGEVVASWCFIAGSYGFVVASFFNAVCMTLQKTMLSIPGPAARKCYWISVAGLFFSLMGGVLFVVGSYLYRPEFNTHCREYRSMTHDSFEATWCLNTLNYGTWLYIVGSCFYLIQAYLNLTKCCIKAQTRGAMEGHLPVVPGPLTRPPPNFDQGKSVYYSVYQS